MSNHAFPANAMEVPLERKKIEGLTNMHSEWQIEWHSAIVKRIKKVSANGKQMIRKHEISVLMSAVPLMDKQRAANMHTHLPPEVS